MKKHEKRLLIKLLMCSIYLVIITILFVASFKLFQEKKTILPFSKITTVEEYSYIKISKMSEKFAEAENKDIGFHFVIEEESSGLWRTYVIAINEKDYNKYKEIIDYSYERIKEKPKVKKVYGYPVIVNEKIKDLAIKNIKNFVPKENKVKITEKNYEKYLTNSYLDTTKSKKDNLSILLLISLFLLFIVIVLFIITIFDKEKIIEVIDKEIKNNKKKVKVK